MKFKVLPILFAFILLLTSCNKQEYKENVPCSDILDGVESVIADAGEYARYDTDFMRYSLENTNLAADYSVSYTVNPNNINEVGIFHTESESAANELKKIVESYIGTMKADQSAFIASYAPEELPKLNDAQIRIYGNYVIYLILDKNDKEIAIEKIENMLEK